MPFKLVPELQLRRTEQTGLGTMIEPAKHAVDQWQRFATNSPRFRLIPIRQNASAEVVGVRFYCI
jgi:hypothetical protein